MDRRQLAAWAGMIGPTLFVAVFSIEGWLRPGYDPRQMVVSELALGPRGWIQSANFVVLGMLFLLFTRGVTAEFRDGKAAMSGPTLLSIIGVGFLASGFFVMDPMNIPREQMSQTGRIHNFLGALVFSLSPVSCFVFLRRFRADPRWRSLQWWTLAAGTITVGAVVLQSLVPPSSAAPPNALTDWVGVIQRTALITYLAWVFIFARELGRQSVQSEVSNHLAGGRLP